MKTDKKRSAWRMLIPIPAILLGVAINAAGFEGSKWAAGILPECVNSELSALTGGEVGPALGGGKPAVAMFAALSNRSSLDRLIGDRYSGLVGPRLPESLTVITWVRIEPSRPATLLFGIGDSSGDSLVGATDESGSPILVFQNRLQLTQTCRAPAFASRLADSRLHVVVAVVNMGSGLIRMYVDGKPETAGTISLWRPQNLGLAFATYSLQGQIDAPGSGTTGLLMPRVVGRELTEAEIADIRPMEDAFGNEYAQIDPALAHLLSRETLVEFWPPEFSYRLRTRPMGAPMN